MCPTAAHKSEHDGTAALCHDYSKEDNVRKWLAANLNEDSETKRPTRVASCNSLFASAISTLRFPRRRPDLCPVLSVRSLGSLSQGNEPCVTTGAQCPYNEDQEL
mmetsp:Transcript_98765/g.144555  ORF Transcript_98765/g.144555 Transcript_98765/m.144555 type:complete len:105 (-) Transcript_98765:57-371(-)